MIFGKETPGLLTWNNKKCFSVSAIPHCQHWFRFVSHYSMFSTHEYRSVILEKDQGLERHLPNCSRKVWTRLQMYSSTLLWVQSFICNTNNKHCSKLQIIHRCAQLNTRTTCLSPSKKTYLHWKEKHKHTKQQHTDVIMLTAINSSLQCYKLTISAFIWKSYIYTGKFNPCPK